MSAPTLWIDITELFGQFALSSHPTGVSRVVINLVDALAAEPGPLFGDVQPIFWHPIARRPLMVADAGLGQLLEFFPKLKDNYVRCGCEMPAVPSGLSKGLMTSVPKPFRFRLFPYLHGVTHFLSWTKRVKIGIAPVAFSPHDCLFVPGSFWLDRYAPSLSRMARAQHTVVTGFVHDFLLLSHPEWTTPPHAKQFKQGVDAFLPSCAAIACNSRYTAEELRRYVDLPAEIPIEVCRLGDTPVNAPAAQVSSATETLLDRRFVLFVSTLIPRKNHRLLFQAWEKLWSLLGDATPFLLLVGGGTPDQRLAEAMSRVNSINRVIRLGDVDDHDLEALYTHAWLTVYPSLDEGYGLPVAEALARGKISLATASGGLREISSDLVDVIASDNADDLVSRIMFYVTNPDSVKVRERQIRNQYRPTLWSNTAQSVRRLLEGAVLGIRSPNHGT